MPQLSLDAGGSLGTETRVDPGMWDDAVRPVSGHQIVVGGPGTGKTEFLCRRAALAVDRGTRPETMLVIGFSRDGTNRIRSRLTDLIGPAGHRINVATYHSLAMRIVEASASEFGWPSPPTVLTGIEQERLISDLLSAEDPLAWSPAYRAILATDAMASEVTDFLLRAREHRATAEAIEAQDRDQWKGLAGFMRRYDAALIERGRIDYGRALDLATDLVEREPGTVGETTMVLVDEYQDTSPVQADLLFAIGDAGAQLTVAADPYQSIYSFRGTDIQNVYDFPARAEAALGTPAQRLVLTTSFRVPAEILDASVAVTARELPGGVGRVLSTRSGGSVACHEFATFGEEAEWIASDIERLHIVEQVPVDRFAVFVRTHSPFVDELARALDRRGITHEYVDDRLVDQPIIRFLHDLVAIAAASGGASTIRDASEDSPAATLRRILSGPFVGLSPSVAASVPDEPAEWPDWIRRLGDQYKTLAEFVDDRGWCTDIPANQGMWRVWSSIPSLAEVATSPDRHRDRSAWSAYAQMLDRSAVRSPGSTLLDVVEAAAGVDFEADALLDLTDGGVTIATLHRSKGTEYDIVYIADATEGQFPDLRVTDSMLGVRHLNTHLPSDTSSYVTFRLDEERRLAYTAMTRSTSRVVWTATVDGEGRSASRFMPLVARTTPPAAAESPLTPRAFLARMRQILSDPDVALYERIAALLFIADPTVHGADPMEWYGTRSRGSNSGIVPSNLRLSPSQAMDFDGCPRRYAVGRFLLTLDEETVHLRLGSLVHKVIEVTETEATEAGNERGTVEDALGHLTRLWPDLGFGDDAVGRAWRRRTEEALENLYGLWPSSATPIAHEIKLPLTIAGTPWRGRADRVERVEDEITVVDYKTGRVVSVPDAAQSLQLGYYALAAAAHPDVADHGSVTGAEFWYPTSPLTKRITTRSFDIDNLGDIEERLVGISELIRSEAFEATPGPECQRCPVARSCPAVEQGEEAFAS